MTTPSVKQFAFGDRHYQLQEIGIWKTKPFAEFLCHGRFRFQHQIIADVSLIPNESSGKRISSGPSSVSFRARTPLGACFFNCRGRGRSNHMVVMMSIQLTTKKTIHCDRRTPPKHSSRGLSVQPIFFNINGAVTVKASGQRHSRRGNSQCSSKLGRGSCGGRGRRVHHLEDESFGVKEQRKGSI